MAVHKKKSARAKTAAKATPKTTPAAKKKKSTGHTAKSIAASATKRTAVAGTTTVPAAVFARLAVGLPVLTAAQIAALDAQVSDAAALELGRSTRAANVVNLMATWGPIQRPALDQFATELASVGYTPARLAYALVLIARVQTAAAAQAVTASSKKGASQAQSTQQIAAKSLLQQLLHKMRSYAGHDSPDAAALALLTNRTATDSELATSLQTHAALAATWLARTDANSEFLASTASLTTADVTAAQTASAQLVTHAASPGLDTTNSERDSSPVNLAEGRELAEQRVAYRAFVAAQALNKRVPTLPLLKGTAHVFVHAPRKAKTTPATSTPTTGTATTGAATTGSSAPVATPPHITIT